MIIDIYKNLSENNAINKKLLKITSLTGTVKEPLSEQTGEVLIEQNVSDLANYCFIPEFNRYYYITKKEHIRTGLVKLSLRCDVLMSFKSFILGLIVVVERSEHSGQPYLVDTVKSAFNFPMVLTRKFPGGFTGFNYYLTVASGGEQTENGGEQNEI